MNEKVDMLQQRERIQRNKCFKCLTGDCQCEIIYEREYRNVRRNGRVIEYDKSGIDTIFFYR